MADAAIQGLFENMQVASWSVASRRFAFAAIRIQQTGGNRIVERERPYRDGARLDDTGSKAVCWVLDVIFNNTIQEPDLDNGFPQYPDTLEELIASFDLHETGDLVLPTVGRRRCRAETYVRTEQFEGRDEATVCFTFKEDNEDVVDFRQPTPPSAGGSAVRLAQATTFSAQSAGAWHDSLAEFRTLMSQLESIANLPQQYATDLHYAAAAISGSATRALQAFRHPGRPGRDTFSVARGNRAERRMVLARDVASRRAAESSTGEPKLVGIVLRGDSSLFAVSAATGQSLTDLIAWNPQLDASFVPAGTVILVRA